MTDTAGPTPLDDLFAPPGVAWRRLHPNYLRMKLWLIPITWTILFGIGVAALYLFGPSWSPWLLAAVAVPWIVWRMVRAPRVFRRWGYAERDEDVYLTSGLWRRHLQCVPYGRMQLVEVHSGPIDRRFGLASVEMVTSSTSGTITIPGLAADDAAALRDRLISRGEQQQAGI
ncbi:MAG: PH domain-containing protein [Tessaracoccus sp.]|uniref:PH domain-containing protein n=1 Tax=Tessaracoccus sp. TaxID=1971211 RepID=UPI001EBBB444|nr:PH domain-containing protein [Tessaracoccus sp.]MBK7822481.1 PH domain-containing protein [Tessaracoccus sp.]